MAIKKTLCRVVVLGEDVAVTDIARALEFKGLAVSHKLDPTVFVVNRVPRKLPSSVVAFERPALTRRQAE